jgi:hypothetical protein
MDSPTGPMPGNPFRRLLQIDVSKHIEHKGGFAYLSWPFAVAQLRQADPDAHWEIRRFDGLPYLATDLGYFVEVAVTVQGVTLSQIHPVLDGRNRPIPAPSAFEINTSIQRCLVKAIALHGLGLSIYAGEDLQGIPEEPTAPPPRPERPAPTGARPVPQAPVRAGESAEFLTSAQLRYLERLIDDTGTDVHELLDYFGFESLDRVPRNQVNRVIRSLEGKRRAA